MIANGGNYTSSKVYACVYITIYSAECDLNIIEIRKYMPYNMPMTAGNCKSHDRWEVYTWLFHNSCYYQPLK